MTAVVELHGVTKAFGSAPVLHGIELSVAEHQIVSLIGPSGCGKSTLLKCINALEPVDAGDIWLDGERVSGPGADLNFLRRRVGIVFQNFNLFPHLSVLDNITLAPRKVLKQRRESAEQEARRLLDRIGLGAKALAYPDRLSGGQQQRVAIVRALAMNPRLLLLDEVTSALDPQLVGEVLAIIAELAAEGMTMILATHEMEFAREVSDLVCFLHEGRIHESGPPEQVLGDPRSELTRAFLRREGAGAAAARAT
jgi:polar amino acid transport system ATP-binding protein